jgi:hypothetical protein
MIVGRYGYKDKVESMLKLDISRLKAIGVNLDEGVFYTSGIINWTSGKGAYTHNSSISYIREGDTFTLYYKYNDKPVKEDIELLRTPCNYGSSRVWFSCPSCSRRVRCLYGTKYFRCRKCHDLIYESQCEALGYRMLRKRNKLLNRLGTEETYIPFIIKPKRMRQFTFKRHLITLAKCNKVFNIWAINCFNLNLDSKE